MDNRQNAWLEALDRDWSGPLRLTVRGRSMWPTLRPGDQVTVEPAAVDDLKPGDWALLRGPSGLLLHRFLGLTSEGRLLTKGDGRRGPDSPWPPEALIGRAVAFSRDGRTLPVSSSSLRERARTGAHRLMAAAWSFLRRGGFALLLLALLPLAARASVDLVSFEAVPDRAAGIIRVSWKTATETNMSYFWVQRAVNGGSYARVSQPILAVGDIIGADYEYVDADVVEGPTYYYRLEAVETNGVADIYGPISASLLPPTPTPTPAPSPTPTRTPSPSPTPTRTPAPTTSPSAPRATPRPASVQFWADRDRIARGECVVVHWRVENVQAVYYQGQMATGSEDRQVCPSYTTTYALRVVADAGEELYQITVYVQGAAPVPAPTSAPTPQPPATPAPPADAAPPLSPPVDAPLPPVEAAAAPTPLPGAEQPLSPLPAPGLSPAATATPTPTSTLAASSRRPRDDGEEENVPFPCGWVAGLIAAGTALILLGWWASRRRTGDGS